jgi:hypothetical protein
MGSGRAGIVVDVGCASHEGDGSIEPLVERFKPEVLFGFDPQVYPVMYPVNETTVVLRNEVAWVKNGRMRFDGEGLGAHVVDKGGKLTKCIDIVQFVAKEGRRPLYLKLDCEGSEYEIVKSLIKHRVDATIDLLMIEWHCGSCHHGIWSHALSCDYLEEAEALASGLEQQLACPYERWEA